MALNPRAGGNSKAGQTTSGAAKQSALADAGSTALLQAGFVDSVRDSKAKLPQGVDGERMKIYRRLVYNSIDGFFSRMFPASKRFFGPSWGVEVEAFIANHKSSCALFHQFGSEFLAWLKATKGKDSWVYQLAHFEWSKIELELADLKFGNRLKTRGPPPSSVTFNEPKQRLKLSPLVKLVRYSWPIWELAQGAKTKPKKPAPSNILIWRKLSTHKLEVMQAPDGVVVLVELAALQEEFSSETLTAKIEPVPSPRIKEKLRELLATMLGEEIFMPAFSPDAAFDLARHKPRLKAPADGF